jgi:hypothetical protein
VGGQPAPPRAAARRLPLWVKLLYTAFVAVLVPFYLREYGPTNFLYFCDVALLMAVAAVWLESPLLASMPLVGIFLAQMVWVVDFLGGLVGHHVTGMTAYMFNPGIALFARFLSFFHFWLPFFLLVVVLRLGYDRRAFAAWTALALGLMLVCYFLMPAPPPPADNPNLPVNINYVYGLSDDKAQTWLPPLAYLAVLMVGFPLLLFLPMHLILARFAPRVPVPGGEKVEAGAGPRA